MAQDTVDALAERPSQMSRWAFIQFGPDYGAERPIWTLEGLADIDAMHLPADLEARLRRWASYWDDTYDYETGWPMGLPEAWWRDEQSKLPRELAVTIGRDAVVMTVEGEMLRSRAPGTSPEADAAMRNFINAGESEDRQLDEDRSNGFKFASNVIRQFRSRRRGGEPNDR